MPGDDLARRRARVASSMAPATRSRGCRCRIAAATDRLILYIPVLWLNTALCSKPMARTSLRCFRGSGFDRSPMTVALDYPDGLNAPRPGIAIRHVARKNSGAVRLLCASTRARPLRIRRRPVPAPGRSLATLCRFCKNSLGSSQSKRCPGSNLQATHARAQRFARDRYLFQYLAISAWLCCAKARRLLAGALWCRANLPAASQHRLAGPDA